MKRGVDKVDFIELLTGCKFGVEVDPKFGWDPLWKLSFLAKTLSKHNAIELGWLGSKRTVSHVYNTRI